MRYSQSNGTVWVAANTTWYVYNFRRRLIETLLELGYRVVAYSPVDDYVLRVEELGVRYVRLPIDNASTNPLREFATLLRMYRMLRRERPTVLLTFTPKVNIYGSLAARMLGIPVIANLSGLGRAFVAGGWLEFMVRRLYRLALARTRTVFFQNEEDRTLFVGAGLVESRKAKRLPGSGVDIERFQPIRRTGETGRFVFLLGGRLLWDKGVGQFVEAAREVKRQFPQAEFRLVGFLEVQNPSAISRAQIEEWDTEGVIGYHGATDDMPTRFAESDCVVLPSYYREGVPRTLLEAASMGIPIITTDTTGCRDTVEDGVTGFLVKPRNPRDLADKMRRMLGLSPEERDAMGQRGRDKMCREFDERIVIDSYVNAILGIDGAAGAVDSAATRARSG
jgi:glycosyltransferase involved in cell wall biosynthesis